MARAARKAARGLMRDFGEVEHLQVSRKGPGDFVSTADTRPSRSCKDELQQGAARLRLLLGGRRRAPRATTHQRWIVDPLDGTTNFLHGLPHWAISIALEHEGEIVAGVRLRPDRATRCSGPRRAPAPSSTTAACASRRAAKLDEAVIATGMPFRGRGDHADYLRELAAVMPRDRRGPPLGLGGARPRLCRGRPVRRLLGKPSPAWDVAAGLLMVTEAGGFASEIGGGRNPLAGESVLAANSHLHLLLGKVLRNASANRKPQAEG